MIEWQNISTQACRESFRAIEIVGIKALNCGKEQHMRAALMLIIDQAQTMIEELDADHVPPVEPNSLL